MSTKPTADGHRIKRVVLPIQYLTEREVAEMGFASVRTLQAWRLQEKGPPYLHVERSVRYRLSDIEKWLDAQTVQPKPSSAPPSEDVLKAAADNLGLIEAALGSIQGTRKPTGGPTT
jgi:predicted DNA-binding transcriptional regulator AlpA